MRSVPRCRILSCFRYRVWLLGLSLALVAATAPAQDLCAGLVTDKLAHPMTALAKPALLQTATDPQFGTIIRRISAAPAGNHIRPVYSTISAWNADESRLILYDVASGKHELYDGRTYQFIRTLNLVSPTDLEQILWDPADPDVFYYPSSYNAIPALYRYRVSTDTSDVVRDFTGLAGMCPRGDWNVLLGLGNDPMYLSWANGSKVVGLQCGQTFKFLYDIKTNTVTGSMTVAATWLAPQPAPSGQLAYGYGKVYDASLRVVRTLDLASSLEHASLGQLASGHDTYNAVAFDPGPLGSDVGSLVTFDMTDGTSRVIVGEATGYPYPPSNTHVSAMAYKRPGYVSLSIVGNPSGSGVLDQEIVLADTNPGGKVCRVAHHRSSGSFYWAEPHAVPSPSGTRILFASDWGNSGTVDAFVVELPSYGGAAGDLSVTAGASPSPVAYGAQLTYTLTARNLGSTAVSGVTLTDTLPAGTSFVSASAGCAHSAGTVTCSLGSLGGSASSNVTIVVQADSVGTAVNRASVAGGITDPNPSNNSVSTSTPVWPTVSINDVAVTEGNSGTVTAQFTLSLSVGSSSTVMVAFATANGTASSGKDYAIASGTVSFSPGSVQRTINVTVYGDTTIEADETFFVNLSSPSGAILADAQGLGTIRNDDSRRRRR